MFIPEPEPDSERTVAYLRLLDLAAHKSVRIDEAILLDLHACDYDLAQVFNLIFVNLYLPRTRFGMTIAIDLSWPFVTCETRALTPIGSTYFGERYYCTCGTHFWYDSQPTTIHKGRSILMAEGFVSGGADVTDIISVRTYSVGDDKINSANAVSRALEAELEQYSIKSPRNKIIAKDISILLYYLNDFEEFVKDKITTWHDWKRKPDNADRSRNALVFADEVWKPLIRDNKADLKFFLNYDGAGYRALAQCLSSRRRRASKPYNGINTPRAWVRSWLAPR